MSMDRSLKCHLNETPLLRRKTRDNQAKASARKKANRERRERDLLIDARLEGKTVEELRKERHSRIDFQRTSNIIYVSSGRGY